MSAFNVIGSSVDIAGLVVVDTEDWYGCKLTQDFQNLCGVGCIL